MLVTKSKNNSNNQRKGIVISVLVLAIISAAMLVSYIPNLRNAERIVTLEQGNYEEDLDSEKNDFLKELLMGNYCLYWEAVNAREHNYIMPSNIYLNSYQDVDIKEFNNVFDEWHERFFSEVVNNYDLEYYILDGSTRKSLTNTNRMLSSLLENSEKSDKLKKTLSFYIVINYEEDGDINITQLSGLENKYISELISMDSDKTPFSDENFGLGGNHNILESPKNVTIIYASRKDNLYMKEKMQESYQRAAFSSGGFSYIYWIAVISVILLGLLLPLKKSWRIGERIAIKIPFEICSLFLVLIMRSYDSLVYMAVDTAKGRMLNAGTVINSELTVFPEWIDKILAYGINGIVWMLVFGTLFLSILSYRQLFVLGIKKYIREKTIIYKLVSIISKKIHNFFKTLKNFFKSLKEIDLTDSTNKDIIKILIVNFVILTIFCSIWFLGIIGLIIYSIALYYIIKKYVHKTKKNYKSLVEVTSKMAKGNLEVSMEEDLGIFEPLKLELSKIRFGFKKAVEDEMKSEKMKSELITNVSHDLKTPLTAIITYINLLKEEDLSQEEIHSYIDTIDKKSQRLKVLIEDLFEISKASSNNVVFNFVELDLVSLIKQVLLELDDKIKSSGVEFRTKFPENKVILMLDSDKTYRIFENLLTNIIKYAMPHTRAYIDITVEEETVTVVFKNVSAEELAFHPDEITERFVRGDKSRNTEGSGLGLAIVKSFVELQKGSFQVLLDGDLFKTVIEWKRP